MSKPTFLVLLCTRNENLPEVYKTCAEMTQDQIDSFSGSTPGDRVYERLFGVDVATGDLDPAVWKMQTPANSKEISESNWVFAFQDGDIDHINN